MNVVDKSFKLPITYAQSGATANHKQIVNMLLQKDAKTSWRADLEPKEDVSGS